MFSVTTDVREYGGTVDELHRRVVHQQVLQLHVGVLRVVHADARSRATGGEVLSTLRLVHARHLAAALAGGLEGLAGDALDLVLASTPARRTARWPGVTVRAGARLVVEALAATEVRCHP